jgi:hypothetical protein
VQPFDIAPNGLTNGWEVDAIWRVVNARRGNMGAPREQFAVRYAVYNLQNEAVIGALSAAVQANCLVQLIVDQSKLDPTKGYQNTDEMLARVGLPVYLDLYKMTQAERSGSFMTSVKLGGRALFHFKLRHFTRAENGRAIVEVFSGSTNPTVESQQNDETYFEVVDPSIQAKYLAAFNWFVDGKQFDASFPVDAWSPTAPLQLSFSPGATGFDSADRLLNLIDAEKELIFLSVFSLRNFNTPTHQASLIDSIKAAVARGAVCVVVTDKKQATIRVNWFLRKNLCFAVYEALNDVGTFNAMHSKDAIFGITQTTIVTDATNWSENALGSCVAFDTKAKPFAYKKDTCAKAASIESMLFVRTWLLNDNGETRRRAFYHMFLLLTRYQRQQSTSTPSAAAVIGMLESKFGRTKMPFQRMQVFVAGVDTNYGEFVGIRGQLCNDDACSSRSDVRIRHANMQNRDSQWHKASYDLLSWGEDTALDYVSNADTTARTSIDATYDINGYGYDSTLDAWNVPQAWRLDVFVDAPYGAYVQFKAVHVRNGGAVTWEKDIAAPTQINGTVPKISNDKNHFARVGFASIVTFNSPAQSIVPLAANPVDTESIQLRGDGDEEAPTDDGFVETADEDAPAGPSSSGSNGLLVGVAVLAVLVVLLLAALVAAVVMLRQARSRVANA